MKFMKFTQNHAKGKKTCTFTAEQYFLKIEINGEKPE